MMPNERIRSMLSEMRDVEFVGGVDDKRVVDASTRLGCPFPPEYVAFLKEFGCGGVSSEEFLGLGGARHLDVAWIADGLRGRPGTPSFGNALIPLWADGFGNYDCIDTSQPSQNGEFQIIEWRHDLGAAAARRVLAPSHSEWFLAKLLEIQELDDEETS